MKQYILSILCLLAAFVLPAAAQNNHAGTKAAPAEPAMPYKLTLVTIDGNNGTVAVEDNANGGGGVFTVGTDTFAYGASTVDNATTVKLTVTPTDGYVVRTGYPKAYKTGDTGTTVTISGSESPYTFTMPGHPVTVEIAYANKIKSVAAITLKEEVTADNVVSALPGFVHFTLSSGRKDSLAVTGWTFSKSGSDGEGTTFNPAAGAVNRFSYTAATLPDSIVDNDKMLEALIPVANMAKPLTPTGTDKITIKGGIGENLYSDTEAFNGTIEGGTVKSLEVAAGVTDATLTLSGVTVAEADGSGGTTTIKDGADLTLKIEGENNLGTLKVESGATVVLDKSEGATLNETTIENLGIFRDSTATVTEVTGTAALSISGNLNGGGSVTTNTPVTLTATTKDAAGETTFIWQRQNADGSYTEVERKSYDDNGSPVTKATVSSLKDEYKPATASAGTTHYRCLIERTVSAQGGGAPATTLLSTQPATVEVKSGGGDTPPSIPVYYRVTLPTVEGFTTAPAAGLHVVEEGYSFSFALTREEGYTGDLPTVTTNRGETIAPRESDGKYIIRNVDRDITISFGSHPTANGAVEVDAIRIWNTTGGVNIHTPQAVAAAIYTLSGHCVKQFTAPAGDSRIALPKGLYIVVAGQQQQKIIVH